MLIALTQSNETGYIASLKNTEKDPILTHFLAYHIRKVNTNKFFSS